MKAKILIYLCGAVFAAFLASTASASPPGKHEVKLTAHQPEISIQFVLADQVNTEISYRDFEPLQPWLYSSGVKLFHPKFTYQVIWKIGEVSEAFDSIAGFTYRPKLC